MGFTSDYSLADLESLSGFPGRTIRSYIQRGLVPGANGKGRAAKYSSETLDGLLFIREVKNHANLGLPQLRRLMLQLSPERIRAIGSGEETVAAFVVDPTEMLGESLHFAQAAPLESDFKPLEDLACALPVDDGETNSALDFIRRIRSAPGKKATSTPPSHPSSKLERAAKELDGNLAHRKPTRKARSEWWATISITPDIELRARGLDGNDLAALERIADTLRHLISRNKH